MSCTQISLKYHIILVKTFAVFQKWLFKIFQPEAIAVVLTSYPTDGDFPAPGVNC